MMSDEYVNPDLIGNLDLIVGIAFGNGIDMSARELSDKEFIELQQEQIEYMRGSINAIVAEIEAAAVERVAYKAAEDIDYGTMEEAYGGGLFYCRMIDSAAMIRKEAQSDNN